MTDDTIDVIEPFDFHPCNTPRGMQYYDLNILTDEQQTQLNDFKRDLVRQNEKYLARHPEIRALVALVTRHILIQRPRTDVPECVGQFFARPKIDLEHEMKEYIQEREPHKYEGDSAVCLHKELSEEESIIIQAEEEIEKEEESLTDLPQHILDEILEKAYKRLGIDVDNVDDMGLQTLLYGSESTDSIVKGVISEVLTKVTDEREQAVVYLKKTELEVGEASDLIEAEKDEIVAEQEHLELAVSDLAHDLDEEKKEAVEYLVKSEVQPDDEIEVTEEMTQRSEGDENE